MEALYTDDKAVLAVSVYSDAEEVDTKALEREAGIMIGNGCRWDCEDLDCRDNNSEGRAFGVEELKHALETENMQYVESLL